MRLFTVFLTIPLLLIPAVLYYACELAGIVSTPLTAWNTVAGDQTVITAGVLVTLIAAVLLMFEIMKATIVGSRVMVDHALSILFLLAAVMTYALVPGFGTETFLLIVVFSLVDVIAGVIISQATARRDIGFGIG